MFTRTIIAILLALFSFACLAFGQTWTEEQLKQPGWKYKVAPPMRRAPKKSKVRKVDRAPEVQASESPPEKVYRTETVWAWPEDKAGRVKASICLLGIVGFLVFVIVVHWGTPADDFSRKIINVENARPIPPPGLWEGIQHRFKFRNDFARAFAAGANRTSFRLKNRRDTMKRWNGELIKPEKEIMVHIFGNGGAGNNIVPALLEQTEKNLLTRAGGVGEADADKKSIEDAVNLTAQRVGATLVDTNWFDLEESFKNLRARTGQRFFAQTIGLRGSGKGGGRSEDKTLNALMESQEELCDKFGLFPRALNIGIASGARTTGYHTFIPMVKALREEGETVLAVVILPSLGEATEKKYRLAEEWAERVNQEVGIIKIRNTGAYIGSGPRAYDRINAYIGDSLNDLIIAATRQKNLDNSDYENCFGMAGAQLCPASSRFAMTDYLLNPDILEEHLQLCLNDPPPYIEYSGPDKAFLLGISGALNEQEMENLKAACYSYLGKRCPVTVDATFVNGDQTREKIIRLSLLRSNGEPAPAKKVACVFSLKRPEIAPAESPSAITPTREVIRAAKPRKPSIKVSATIPYVNGRTQEHDSPQGVTVTDVIARDKNQSEAPAEGINLLPLPIVPHKNGHAAEHTTPQNGTVKEIAAQETTPASTPEPANSLPPASAAKAESTIPEAVAVSPKKQEPNLSLMQIFVAATVEINPNHKTAMNILANDPPANLSLRSEDKPPVFLKRIIDYKSENTLTPKWKEACFTALYKGGLRFHSTLNAAGRTIYLSADETALSEAREAISEKPEFAPVRQEIELRISVIRALGFEYVERFKLSEEEEQEKTATQDQPPSRTWKVFAWTHHRINSFFGARSTRV